MDKPAMPQTRSRGGAGGATSAGAMKPATATISTAATVSNDSTSCVDLPCKVPAKLTPVIDEHADHGVDRGPVGSEVQQDIGVVAEHEGDRCDRARLDDAAARPGEQHADLRPVGLLQELILAAGARARRCRVRHSRARPRSVTNPPSSHMPMKYVSLGTKFATSDGVLKMPMPMTMPTSMAAASSVDRLARGAAVAGSAIGEISGRLARLHRTGPVGPTAFSCDEYMPSGGVKTAWRTWRSFFGGAGGGPERCRRVCQRGTAGQAGAASKRATAACAPLVSFLTTGYA